MFSEACVGHSVKRGMGYDVTSDLVQWSFRERGVWCQLPVWYHVPSRGICSHREGWGLVQVILLCYFCRYMSSILLPDESKVSITLRERQQENEHFLWFYFSARKRIFGKVIFSDAHVSHSAHRGRGLCGGGCMQERRPLKRVVYILLEWILVKATITSNGHPFGCPIIRTFIQNAILFIDTSTMLDTTMLICNVWRYLLVILMWTANWIFLELISKPHRFRSVWMDLKDPFTSSVSVNTATTLQWHSRLGVATHFQVSPLISMRTESPASSQRCSSVDADA